jgi:transcriptional regulator with XRE-family HTH domain
VESVSVVLSKRIRRMRERAGLNQTQLAHKVLCSKSHISDIELGNVLPTLDEIQLMEQAVDADGVLLELYDLLNIGVQESATVADAEQGALALTDWESRLMPGLLQTPDYARAAMADGTHADRLEREVAIRLARQKILGSLVAGWFIISEAVLHLVYGDHAVMRGQLARVEAVAAMPNISVQVMPFTSTRHPGGDGPLRVVEYRDKPGIWFTEGPRSGRMSSDREEVLTAMHSLNLIRSAALTVHESAGLIRQVREKSYGELA